MDGDVQPFDLNLLTHPEADEQADPIADAARAILDGHIFLSRTLAEAGHYPAIDVESSISRAMTEITAPPHQELARSFKQNYALYQQNQDIINVGAYTSGSDPRLDEAIAMRPRLMAFLSQDMHQRVGFEDSLRDLSVLLQNAQTPDGPSAVSASAT